MEATRRLTSTYSYVLGRHGTLTQQSPSGAHRDPLKRVGRGVLVAIGISLFIVPNAGSAISMQPVISMTVREYAAVLVDDKKQMKCLGLLYGKESAWNPKAKNGSHYGIPQGRSIYLKTATPEQQIQWGLKYIDNHRIYKGDICKAWQHWKDHNWH